MRQRANPSFTVPRLLAALAALLPTAAQAQFTTSDAVADDLFGGSVSVSGETAIVGASCYNNSAYDFERNQGGAGAWGEVIKLTASDAAADDWFGEAVSISADTAIVGALRNDHAGSASGSAYVFERNHGGTNNWGEVVKLSASDAAGGDVFGNAVSISGDTAIVGASGNDNGGNGSGAAYVFERNQGGAGAWGEVARVTPSDADERDVFGKSVSISGDTAIVGARFNDAINPGSAYVFERNHGGAGAWGEVTKLTPSDAAGGDLFGWSVSISGDVAIVGAIWNDEAGFNSGSAYVFERNHGGVGAWGELLKLTASDAAEGDLFGQSVSVSGDTAIVGANGNDDAGSDSGSAYVFERNHGGAGAWGEVIKLSASDATAGDFFGQSVSISGKVAIVGAVGNDDDGTLSGSAYIFDRNQGGADNWGEFTKLSASDAGPEDAFGFSVSISGNAAIVGAFWNDEAGADSGSAYIYTPEPGTPTLAVFGLALLLAAPRRRLVRPAARVR